VGIGVIWGAWGRCSGGGVTVCQGIIKFVNFCLWIMTHEDWELSLECGTRRLVT
jgi:hypothetical protein